MHSFDGHNDVLLRLWRQGGDAPGAFLDGEERGQLDLPRAIKGQMAGGLYAIFVPSDGKRPSPSPVDVVPYDVPLPAPPVMTAAQQATLEMASLLFRIEERSKGRVRIARSVGDIRAAKAVGAHAPVLHIEGCEAIDPDLKMLDVLYAAGLRSLGPVWSRPNIFGHGVPFRFPSSPDIGEGLTDLGKALVKRCNEMRILIDLSHLNEKGFWDVARLSQAPLVASHSNAHALSASARNLTDKQLEAVGKSNGVVGVNFHKGFLRADGNWAKKTSVSEIANHARYIADKIGEDHVALGSDFDGAAMPEDLHDAAGLPNLLTALEEVGFRGASLDKVAHGNWVRVLKQTWGE